MTCLIEEECLDVLGPEEVEEGDPGDDVLPHPVPELPELGQGRVVHPGPAVGAGVRVQVRGAWRKYNCQARVQDKIHLF